MKFAFCDYRLDFEEEQNLINLDFKIIKTPCCSVLDEATKGHPDMLMNFLDNKTILLHKDINKNFIKKLKDFGFDVILSKNSIESKYPKDIILNSVNTKNLFIHYLKYTDNALLDNVQHKTLIDVKQGYSKCSTLYINEESFITSDLGIGNSLKKIGCDVLILPFGDILLPPLDYGFIGGTCGMLDEKTIGFYGSLDYYKYGKEVLTFLKKHNTKAIYLRKG
ncbi:MAG: DUF6873 family GME fold protein, partial [Clostridiaceae bacterium]